MKQKADLYTLTYFPIYYPRNFKFAAGVKINKIKLSRYFMNFANTPFLEMFVSFLFYHRPQHEFNM